MDPGRLLLSIRRRARLARVRRWIIWIGGTFLLYTYLAGPHGFLHYRRLKGQERDLIRQRRELQAAAAELEQQIRLLQTDTLYIEKVARERYGFARKGERIYRITPH